MVQLALASDKTSPSDVLSYKFNGRTFLFTLSSEIPNRPSCDSTGQYALNLHTSKALIAINLIINAHNKTVPGETDATRLKVVANGTGKCTLTAGSEDVLGLEFYEKSFSWRDDVFLYGSDVPDTPADFVNVPIISNLASSATILQNTFTDFMNDMCRIGFLEVDEKWTVSSERLSGFNRLLIQVIPGGNRTVSTFQRVYCGGQHLLNVSGIRFYTEAINRDTALVMWRDNGQSRFHGVVFLKENSSWKVDFKNSEL
jgi:hypothetical protein